MLFTGRQRALIDSGEMDLTFRAWKSPQVRAGRSYRFSERHDLAVDTVSQVLAGDIVDSEATRAGERDAATLRAAIARASQLALEDTTLLYRVAFRVIPPGPRGRPDLPVAQVVDRLLRLDRGSEHGPWTLATLEAICERPQVAAARLAAGLGRERVSFKADVRKLKALGLTRSFELGYELTALGEAALAALQAPRGG